jgi:hypothetical protein
MGTDEEGTLARLKVVRKDLVDPTIAEHRGRIKTAGGGRLRTIRSGLLPILSAGRHSFVGATIGTLSSSRRLLRRAGSNWRIADEGIAQILDHPLSRGTKVMVGEICSAHHQSGSPGVEFDRPNDP